MSGHLGDGGGIVSLLGFTAQRDYGSVGNAELLQVVNEVAKCIVFAEAAASPSAVFPVLENLSRYAANAVRVPEPDRVHVRAVVDLADTAERLALHESLQCHSRFLRPAAADFAR
jgi:hypothetical protein